MSETDKTSESDLNLQSENPQTEEPLHTTSFLTIADATSFITQCREFLEKEKLESQDSDGSSASDAFISTLTDQDISIIHEQLFRAWRTIKTENVKVMPNIKTPKSWPPQHDQALQYEETLDSFEEAKSKIDIAAQSQIADRPLSPDLLDLLKLEILHDFTRLTKQVLLSPDEQAKSEVKEPEKTSPILVPKAHSWGNVKEEEKDEIPRDTGSLLPTLKRTTSLNLSIRIYEWSEEDFRRRVENEQKILTPSTSKSEDALALSSPSIDRLSKRKEFSYWLLSQTKKLYDSIVSEQSGESDEGASQNTSSSHTRDSSINETSNKSPILLPPPTQENQGSNTQQDLSLNAFSDDTLSEVTPISTDSESLRSKESGQDPKVQNEDPPTPASTNDSTVSSLDSNPNRRRERSPDDSVSTPKRKTV